MAEMVTDAQALSAACMEFDGVRSFFLFEDGSAESPAGMQDTEKGVGGMFASAGDAGGATVQKLASIWGGSGSESYQQTQQRWDSTAADDAASSLQGSMGFTPPDDGFDLKAMEPGEAASDSLKYNFGGIEGAASAPADDAASSLQGSMGFTPPDDGFDLKAMEPGEAASDSLKYNFGGIEGAASAVQESDGKDDLASYQPDTHGGLLFGNGGDGFIPATLAEYGLLLA